MPLLLMIVLTVSACSSGTSASATFRQFFVNVGSNNASYFTWVDTGNGSIKGSLVGAARYPNGKTEVPSPGPFTGKIVGKHITFDLGKDVHGGEAYLSGILGPRTLTITFPPSDGSCKQNPVQVFRASSLAAFDRAVKRLTTTPTCLPS